MNNMTEKNNLAYLLNRELLKTAERFKKKCPKTDAEVILGAGNMYITGFLVNAPNKEEALKTLADCVAVMQKLINVTPDSFFGASRRINPNQN